MKNKGMKYGIYKILFMTTKKYSILLFSSEFNHIWNDILVGSTVCVIWSVKQIQWQEQQI